MEYATAIGAIDYSKRVEKPAIFRSPEEVIRRANALGYDHFMRNGGILINPKGVPLDIKRILESSMTFPPNLIVNMPELLSLTGASSQFEIPGSVIDLLYGVAKDANPTALVHMGSSKQVAMNRGFGDILATPSADVVSRVSRKGWHPGDYEEMERMSRQSSRFRLKYRSWWNPSTWGEMAAEIDIVSVPMPGGGSADFRLNRNFIATPLATPDDIPGVTEADLRWVA